jgi:hypothetical protein
MTNPYAADYTPTAVINDVKFINLDLDAVAYLFTPPNEWATIDDCGQFSCTGPNNVLVKISRASYSGDIIPIKTYS